MGDQNESLGIQANSISIYENGALTPVTIKELCNNELAIRQLVNDHNLLKIQDNAKSKEIEDIKASNQHLSTSPFVSILTNSLNVIFTIVIGILINVLTSVTDKTLYIWLVSLVGVCMLISSLANILYPFAKNWFKTIRRA